MSRNVQSRMTNAGGTREVQNWHGGTFDRRNELGQGDRRLDHSWSLRTANEGFFLRSDRRSGVSGQLVPATSIRLLEQLCNSLRRWRRTISGRQRQDRSYSSGERIIATSSSWSRGMTPSCLVASAFGRTILGPLYRHCAHDSAAIPPISDPSRSPAHGPFKLGLDVVFADLHESRGAGKSGQRDCRAAPRGGPAGQACQLRQKDLEDARSGPLLCRRFAR